MGIDDKERKIRKRSDKKFVFDWNADDDTSRDLNPLYTHRHSAQLFGRGSFAGIDLKDNKSKDKFYDKLLANRRTDAEVARAGYVLVHTSCLIVCLFFRCNAAYGNLNVTNHELFLYVSFK